jgi:hypothetical protein
MRKHYSKVHKLGNDLAIDKPLITVTCYGISKFQTMIQNPLHIKVIK